MRFWKRGSWLAAARLLSLRSNDGQMRGLIFAVVGPSGSGKSVLVAEMLRRLPNALELMRSLTTRSKRATEDDLTTRFVSRQEFLKLASSGALVQWVEYDGHMYGDARSDVEAIFEKGKCCIRPLIEEGVQNFRARGYMVVVVRITPCGSSYHNRSLSREILDAERVKDHLPPDVEIENRFDDGGYAAACDAFATFIEQRLKTHSAGVPSGN